MRSNGKKSRKKHNDSTRRYFFEYEEWVAKRYNCPVLGFQDVELFVDDSPPVNMGLSLSYTFQANRIYYFSGNQKVFYKNRLDPITVREDVTEEEIMWTTLRAEKM